MVQLIVRLVEWASYKLKFSDCSASSELFALDSAFKFPVAILSFLQQ